MMNSRFDRQFAGWQARAVFALGLLATCTGLALTPVVFMLDWRPNVQFVGNFIALEKGWYRDAGLDVRIHTIGLDTRMVEPVAAGTNWIGCAESGLLIQHRTKGASIRAIGTMLQRSPLSIISLKSRGIRELKDLYGKRVFLHSDGLMAFDLVMRRSRLDAHNVKLAKGSFHLEQLLHGDIDAMQAYLIDEPVTLEAMGHAVSVIPFHTQGYESYAQVYFTSEAFLRQNRAAVQQFLEISNRGWREAVSDTAAASRFAVGAYAPDLSVDQQQKCLEKMIPLLTYESGPGSEGTMRRDTWERIIDRLRASGTVPAGMKVEDFVDFSFSDELARKR
jgi:ABC-type nitrate/sulfonate/bicarbonate transport system substrate-binding protein